MGRLNICISVSAKTVLHKDNWALLESFNSRGHNARIIVWDDLSVDTYSTFDIILIRTCWVFHAPSRSRFLQWLSRISKETLVINNTGIISWNTDHDCMSDLSLRGVDVIPITQIPPSTDPDSAAAAILGIVDRLGWESGIVCPTAVPSSAPADCLPIQVPSSREQEKINSLLKAALPPGAAEAGLGLGIQRPAWISQVENLRARVGSISVRPFMRSIVSEGELSFIFIKNIFSHCVKRFPPKGDFRISHTLSDLRVESYIPSDSELFFAVNAYTAVAASIRDICGKCVEPIFARIDVVRDTERLASRSNGISQNPNDVTSLNASFMSPIQDDEAPLLVYDIELVDPVLYLSYCKESTALVVDAVESYVDNMRKQAEEKYNLSGESVAAQHALISAVAAKMATSATTYSTGSSDSQHDSVASSPVPVGTFPAAGGYAYNAGTCFTGGGSFTGGFNGGFCYGGCGGGTGHVLYQGNGGCASSVGGNYSQHHHHHRHQKSTSLSQSQSFVQNDGSVGVDNSSGSSNNNSNSGGVDNSPVLNTRFQGYSHHDHHHHHNQVNQVHQHQRDGSCNRNNDSNDTTVLHRHNHRRHHHHHHHQHSDRDQYAHNYTAQVYPQNANNRSLSNAFTPSSQSIHSTLSSSSSSTRSKSSKSSSTSNSNSISTQSQSSSSQSSGSSSSASTSGSSSSSSSSSSSASTPPPCASINCSSTSSFSSTSASTSPAAPLPNPYQTINSYRKQQFRLQQSQQSQQSQLQQQQQYYQQRQNYTPKHNHSSSNLSSASASSPSSSSSTPSSSSSAHLPHVNQPQLPQTITAAAPMITTSATVPPQPQPQTISSAITVAATSSPSAAMMMTGNPIGSPLKLSQFTRFSQHKGHQEAQNDLSGHQKSQREADENDEDDEEDEKDDENENVCEVKEGEKVVNAALDACGRSEPIPTHKGKQVKNHMDAFTDNDLFDSPTLPSFSVDSSMIGSLQVSEQSFSYGFIDEKNDD